jgi:hypothetical protein
MERFPEESGTVLTGDSGIEHEHRSGRTHLRVVYIELVDLHDWLSIQSRIVGILANPLLDVESPSVLKGHHLSD